MESGGKINRDTANNDWLECRSDESSRSDYEYKYEEDPESTIVKKYKKSKVQNGAGFGGNESAHTVITEPFIYLETDKYPDSEVPPQNFRLREMKMVLPFGYATQEYLAYLKNDVYNSIESYKT